MTFYDGVPYCNVCELEPLEIGYYFQFKDGLQKYHLCEMCMERFRRVEDEADIIGEYD